MFRTVVASVAILTSVFAASCGPADTTPATVQPAVEPEAVVEPKLEAPALGSEVVLTMTCSALSTSEGFAREVTLTGGSGVYTWTRGAKGTARYEFWEMKLDSGTGFTVTGEYVEGAPDIKTLSFTGTVAGTAVSGQGMRGPRKCTITT